MPPSVDERFLWLNGELLRVNDAKINVLSPTAQFGLNVFEGIRCYWNAERRKLYAFRLPEHYGRLRRSARLLQIDCPYSDDALRQALVDAVRANEYREDIVVRQTLFVDGFGSWGSDSPTGMFVAPLPKARTSAEYNKAGLRCCLSSWRRIGENSLSPRIKCGANYINSRMGQREALRNGYDTCLFLNEAGKVAEGPGSCLFVVRDGRLITPRLTDSVLESITRDTVLVLARELGVEAAERTLDRTELYACDEAFLCGSSMELTPISSVDGFPLNSQNPDGMTARLHAAYLECVRGNRHPEWCTEIDTKAKRRNPHDDV